MLKKLFHYCKNIFNKPKNLSEYGLNIRLLPNYEVDIELVYPNLDDYVIDTIPDIAEKYAQLLVYMNSSSLRNKLINLLESQSKTHEKINDKLFFDNVVAFHDIMREQILINRYNKDPLIRPLSVFSVK